MSAVAAVVGTGEPWDVAWLGALGELELEVDRAEALLRSAQTEPPEVSAWSPPGGLGPLPATLLDRAQAVHERQLRVSARIVESLARNRAQSAVTARIETGQPSASVPVYVDRAC
jgi:hypothetical protein